MRAIIAALGVLLVSSCGGGGPGKRAADACMAEVDQRLAGKTYEIDKEKFRASATVNKDATDTLLLSAPVVFDRGLSSEFTQVLKCKARDDGKSASVISLEFIWNMEDLKLDE